MTTFKAITELCNVVSLVAYCRGDSSMMVILESTSSEYWIPSVKVPSADGWKSAINKEMTDIFSTDLGPKLLKIHKVWLPDQQTNWIYHCIFSILVSEDDKNRSKMTRGKYRGKVRWVSETEMLKLYTFGNLRSPEVMVFMHTIKEHAQPNAVIKERVPQAMEYVQNGKLIEIGQEVLVNLSNASPYEQLVESAGFNFDLQKHLLLEFVFYTFPAVYISKQAFMRFFLELGWSREDIPPAFKAADIAGREGLSFREFIFILCAIDPNTTHGGAPAEIRCRYIFRFFDKDSDNILSPTEFSTFIAYMRKSKSLPPDLAESIKDADAIYKNLGFSANTQLTVPAFLTAVGTLKIRGTSHIFRSPKSAQQYIQGTVRREIKFKASDTVQGSIGKRGIIGQTGYKSQVATKGYELALHSIKLQQNATLINIDQIWNTQGLVSWKNILNDCIQILYRFYSDSVQILFILCSDSIETVFSCPMSKISAALSSTALTILQGSTPEQLRRVSLAVFNQDSESNELLKSLRYLQQLNKQKTYAKGKQLFSWGTIDSEVFGRHLISVCNQVQDMLRGESRLLDLSSPIYIMGDIHGNIADLISFEDVFWHLGPCLCPCNLLFLGDFVDRGAYGLEVITYLICYKFQTPHKIYLLRGNHEIRDIQKMFSFYAECKNKFGDKTGEEVWEAINSVFDCMPLAATIDKKIFCVHGGIPPPYVCPVATAINQIPCPLRHPDQESALAWELMWNDPVKKMSINDTVAMELMANDGFAVNTRRGTAHVFTVEALERFLNTNNFSHIVRAHEVASAGFNVQQKARLLTVFSSSKYCGGTNDAACILADQGKLRILRVETNH